MRINKKIFNLILNLIIVTSIFEFFCSINCIYAAYSPVNVDSYDGSDRAVSSDLTTTLGIITRILATIAGFVCVFKLIQIGIMYMMTGANDKSNAKSAMIPWAVGAVICGGYVVIGKAVIDLIEGATKDGGVLSPVEDPTSVINSIGEEALGIIAVVAGAVAVGMLIYIGIKYMLSGAQGMAKVKNTLLPWLIGAVIVGGASGLAQAVINIAKSSSGG